MITKQDVNEAYQKYTKIHLELQNAIVNRNWVLCSELSPIFDKLQSDYKLLLDAYNKQEVLIPQISVQLYMLIIYNRDYSAIKTIVIQDLTEPLFVYFEGLRFEGVNLKTLCRQIREYDDFFCHVLAYTLETEDCYEDERVLEAY